MAAIDTGSLNAGDYYVGTNQGLYILNSSFVPTASALLSGIRDVRRFYSSEELQNEIVLVTSPGFLLGYEIVNGSWQRRVHN